MGKILDYLMLIEKLEPLQLILQLLTLTVVAILVIWLSQVFWFRFLARSKGYAKEPIDIIGKLSMLRSLVTYFSAFALYFFFLVKQNGLHAFHWTEPDFYLVMLPRILSYLAPLGIYLNKKQLLNRILK